MKQTLKIISLWIKSYWLFMVLCIIIIIFLMILIFAGSQGQKNFWPQEVISALLATAIVAGITYLLLKGQANSESRVDQNKKVFENRLKAYESFLTTLKDVIIKNEVDESDEKLLQFSIATIGMHADSKEMLKISKNLKYILQKIKIPERIEDSIWNELMIIVNIFHNSLYNNDIREVDTNMRKALRNFRGLCVDENHDILEFVECLLASYNFDSFIAGKCLFYSIPIKKRYVKSRELPNKIYVTLRIDTPREDTHKDSLYSGIVAIYSKETQFEKLCTMLKNPQIWLDTKGLLEETENVELDLNIAKKAFVLPFNQIGSMALQSLLCDIFMFMHPIWAETGVSYLRKDKNGCIKREIPSEKLKNRTNYE